MKSTLVKLFAVTCLVVSAQVKADDIRLGAPGYGGNGCPAGSASVTLSPDKKSLTLIFDQYLVEAGGINARVGRKSCNIAIPVHVPNGLSVSIISADYRGFNSLPRGARSTFSAEYFFAGQRGPKATRSFYGPLDSDYLIENDLVVGALVWSRCGESVNLRVNSSMTTITNSQGDDALSTVDSADFKAGIVYKLQFRRC